MADKLCVDAIIVAIENNMGARWIDEKYFEINDENEFFKSINKYRKSIASHDSTSRILRNYTLKANGYYFFKEQFTSHTSKNDSIENISSPNIANLETTPLFESPNIIMQAPIPIVNEIDYPISELIIDAKNKEIEELKKNHWLLEVNFRNVQQQLIAETAKNVILSSIVSRDQVINFLTNTPPDSIYDLLKTITEIQNSKKSRRY